MAVPEIPITGNSQAAPAFVTRPYSPPPPLHLKSRLWCLKGIHMQTISVTTPFRARVQILCSIIEVVIVLLSFRFLLLSNVNLVIIINKWGRGEKPYRIKKHLPPLKTVSFVFLRVSMFLESFNVSREFWCLPRVSTFPRSFDVSREFRSFPGVPVFNESLDLSQESRCFKRVSIFPGVPVFTESLDLSKESRCFKRVSIFPGVPVFTESLDLSKESRCFQRVSMFPGNSGVYRESRPLPRVSTFPKSLDVSREFRCFPGVPMFTESLDLF